MIKKRLIGLFGDAKKYIACQVAWKWVALVMQIVAIFAVGRLLEEVIVGGDWQGTLPVTAGILVVTVAVRFLCDRMAVKASYRISADVKRILREKIYEKVLRLGASYRQQVTTSSLVQLCGEGVEQLETYFGRYLPQLFYSILAPLTLFLVLARVDLKASLILLICVPLIPLSIVAVQKIAKRLLNRYWGLYTELGDSFLENLQGLTTLKIYQADEMKAKEMDREAQKFRQITMKVLTMQLNSTSVMDIIAYGGAAAGMIVAALEFLGGNLSFAGAIVIILLAAEFFLPLRLLGSFFHIAMNGMAASDRMFELLDLEEREEGSEVVPAVPFSVKVQDLHFSYEENREILKGVNLEFPAGKFVALVGESGSGKSTVAGILCGKNRGYTGDVWFGTTPLAKISEQSLMENVTLIRHDSYLFKGAVEENLRMAKPFATEQEMRDVLEQVNLWSFLEQQEGLGTMLSEQGKNLSGGQRQRLALARALLHDTPVYIFDEATSNIDAESEEMILEVVHRLAGEKTVIMISHRLANIVEADCIYMLKDGVIAESGTHEELVASHGAYHRIYESQRQLEEYGKAVSV